MEDREMLELAAKAAGYGLPNADDHDEIDRQYEYHLGLWVKYPWGWGWFRPHIDDGHALRLAAVLRLHILHNDLGDSVLWVSAVLNKRGLHGVVEFEDESQRAKATRRAIVLAAAEIGKLLA